jgi:calcium-sensing receptor
MGNEKVELIPIVVVALGAVSNKLYNWIEKLGIHIRIELLQKTALLGKARILRSMES